MRFSRTSKSTLERTIAPPSSSSSSFFLLIICACIMTMSTAFTLQTLATTMRRAPVTSRGAAATAAQLQQQHSLRFHSRQQHQYQQHMTTAPLMMMDPAVMEMVTAVTSTTVWGHLHDVAATTTTASVTGTSSASMEAILSTMYAQAAALEAHGHSQPLWGPVDAYLTAGKSIAPPVQNLIDMGITTVSTKTSNAAAAALSTMDAAKSSAELTLKIQEEMSKGWKFLDYNNIQIKNLPGISNYQGYLPGFVDPTSTSLLSQPDARLYPDYNETPESFVLMIKWAGSFINVVDKLPTAAFFYALIEFFILRPNLDTTKRQVQNDPSTAMTESIATTSVRLIVFCVVALLTLIIFG